MGISDGNNSSDKNEYMKSLNKALNKSETDYVTFQAKIKRDLVDDFERVRRSQGKSKKELLEDFIHWCKYEYLDSQGLWQFGEAFINANEKEDLIEEC